MKVILTFVVPLMLLAACTSSMQIEIEHADDVDFSKYSHWNWLPDSGEPEPDVRLADPAVKRRFRTAIDRQLFEFGYRRDPAAANFIVTYHVALTDELSETAVANTYDSANFETYDQNWTYNYAHPWQQGTLIIDILDFETKELVWRGSAMAELKENATDEERDKRVKDAVKKILKNFPPK